MSYSKDHDEFDPCGTCLSVISELVFHDEDEITYMLCEEYGEDFILGGSDEF